jgi:hypothetical protein
VAGDFEGDGRPDLVTANSDDGHVSLLRGNGDGTFQGPRSIPVGEGPGALATADFNADGRLDLAVADSSGNAAFVLINQAADNGSFVTQVYRDFLNRDPDPSGFASFTALLDRGLVNRSQVALAVQESEEYRTLLIQGLYQELLRRDLDPVGLTGWLRYLDDGGTQDGLRTSILGSEEYFQRRGGGTTQGFLSALYSDVLGRTIDPSGARGWSEALEEEDSSRTTVAAEIVGSREGAQVTVNDFYFRFLRRAPDPVGFKASISALQQGVIAELLIMTIIGSDEYFNAP